MQSVQEKPLSILTDTKKAFDNKAILDLYKDHEKIEDPLIREYAKERVVKLQQIAGLKEETMALMKKIEQQAAQLTIESTKLKGAIEYIDGKILERHKTITKQGDVK